MNNPNMPIEEKRNMISRISSSLREPGSGYSLMRPTKVNASTNKNIGTEKEFSNLAFNVVDSVIKGFNIPEGVSKDDVARVLGYVISNTQIPGLNQSLLEYIQSGIRKGEEFSITSDYYKPLLNIIRNTHIFRQLMQGVE